MPQALDHLELHVGTVAAQLFRQGLALVTARVALADDEVAAQALDRAPVGADEVSRQAHVGCHGDEADHARRASFRGERDSQARVHPIRELSDRRTSESHRGRVVAFTVQSQDSVPRLGEADLGHSQSLDSGRHPRRTRLCSIDGGGSDVQ